MNIKQATNIFLSIFNLSIDSDIKDESAFEHLNIVDYAGEVVGIVYKSNTSNQYNIGITSNELGVGVGHVIPEENGYNLSCSFNTQMLHSPNRIYDNITNKMSISVLDRAVISNSLTASKKRKTVMTYSASNATKNINLSLGGNYLSFNEDETKYTLKTKDSSIELDLVGYKSDDDICYEYSTADSNDKNWGAYSKIPSLTIMENMLCFPPFIHDNNIYASSLIQRVRKSSKQSQSLNYFDNIFSLLLSSSVEYDRRDINALFRYIPNDLLSTPKIVSGTEILYPRDKKSPKHI